MLGLLIHVFLLLLCDADSSCPPELNPLTLDPPEVIEEYGNLLQLNCTSEILEHEGMYWRTGTEPSDPEEEDMYVSSPMIQADWDVSAECKIKLNDSFECSKEVEFTVYKIPEVNLSSNHPNAMKNETKYDLQCDIINVAPVRNLSVSWYRGDQLLWAETFTNTTRTPVNESSIQTVSVTRGDKVVQFRCEAKLDFGPRGPQLPGISKTLEVSAMYAPELNSKNSTEDVYVSEGQNVTLHCGAEGSPPPLFFWTCRGMKVVEHTDTLSIPVNISTTCTCTVVNYLGFVTKKFNIHMLKNLVVTTPAPEASAPRVCTLTLTPSEVVVPFGGQASANCSTLDTDVMKLDWESPVGSRDVVQPFVVTWTVEKLEDWTLEPFCYSTDRNGEQCIQKLGITLYKSADVVSVYALDGPMVEGREHRLHCDVINVAPVKNLKVKWYRGDEVVLTQLFNSTRADPINVSSTLRVAPQRDHNGSLFRCEAELDLGPEGPESPVITASANYTAVVHYEPFIKACPDRYTAVEQKFSVDMLPCVTDGNPPPTVQWYLKDQPVNSSEPLTRTDSGEYTAVFENSLGRSNASVHITVEYGPLFICNSHYEVEANRPRTTCEPQGLPAPMLSWFKDGTEEVASPQHWTKHDSGQYLLRATNKHGSAQHTLTLDVVYAPEFKEGNVSKVLHPGENVTLDCGAEGNPPPEVQWNYTSAVDVKETTVWRQRRISISGATSTTGVYICVATNKVGSVTRSVTVAVKDKSQFPFAVLWGLLIVLIIILVLMVLAFVHNRQKKHGRYTFVPDKVGNGSNIPMTVKN